MKLTFLYTLLDILSPLIILVGSHFIYKLAKFLDTKIKSQQTKEVLNLLDNIALNIVKSVQQTYIREHKDGDKPLDKDIATKAKELALEQIKLQIGQKVLADTKKKLKVNEAGMNSLLSSKVEAAVFDLKRLVTPVLILLFIVPFSGCTNSAVIAAATVTTQQKIIATADAATATWYSFKANDCLKQAIDIRDQLKKAGLEQGVSLEKAEVAARREASYDYEKCIKPSNDVATKIADVIDLARKENKLASQVVLDVLRGVNPISSLGNVSQNIINLILDIKKLMLVNEIRL